MAWVAQLLSGHGLCLLLQQRPLKNTEWLDALGAWCSQVTCPVLLRTTSFNMKGWTYVACLESHAGNICRGFARVCIVNAFACFILLCPAVELGSRPRRMAL